MSNRVEEIRGGHTVFEYRRDADWWVYRLAGTDSWSQPDLITGALLTHITALREQVKEADRINEVDVSQIGDLNEEVEALREQVEKEVREVIELRGCCDKRAIRIEELGKERAEALDSLLFADRERSKLKARCASMEIKLREAGIEP